MQKELTLAVLSGITLGVLIAFGIWNSRQVVADKLPAFENKVLSTTEEQTESSSKEASFSLTSHASNQVVTSSSLTLEGKATDARLFIITNEKDVYVSSPSETNFIESIDLDPGINFLVLSALSNDNTIESLSSPIVYSNDYAKQTDSNTLSIATYGIVTDKLESSLQIRSEDSQLKTITIQDSTTYAKLTSSNRSATYEDIGIGDTIAVITKSKELSSIVEADRILVVPSLPESTRSTQFGTLENIEARSGNAVVGENTYELTSGSSLKVYRYNDNRLTPIRFSELEDGQEVVLVGDKTEEIFTPDKIIVLPEI